MAQHATGGIVRHVDTGLMGEGVEHHWPDNILAVMEQERTDRLNGKYARFMPVAHAYAALSKYPGTRVGCAIFGKRFEPLASGWNGAPRGSDADVDQRVLDRDTRLLWACHAEANAIANAAAVGTPLVGATMLVTLFPCMACAKLAVQAGIVRVICPAPTEEFTLKWGKEFDASRQLFAEVGVELVEIDTTGESE